MNTYSLVTPTFELNATAATPYRPGDWISSYLPFSRLLISELSNNIWASCSITLRFPSGEGIPLRVWIAHKWFKSRKYANANILWLKRCWWPHSREILSGVWFRFDFYIVFFLHVCVSPCGIRRVFFRVSAYILYCFLRHFSSVSCRHSFLVQLIIRSFSWQGKYWILFPSDPPSAIQAGQLVILLQIFQTRQLL